MLYPDSIAVIGASSDKKKIGYQILQNILSNGYKGKVYPINLHDKKIAGLAAYKSIAEVKEKIDMAVLCIPAEFSISEIEKCAENGVKNINMITAGFSEMGGVGRLREMKLIEIAKKHNLNILGPNCFGLMNTENDLNATFAKSKNKKGSIAFVSQSGAICSAVLDWSQDKNLGFSKFVSLGNKAILDENDFFEYFAKDKKTDLVVAYLEEITDGRKFMETVSKLSRIKPVAILKSGQSEAGRQAALSHTGSMAGSHESVLAGFRRSGVIILDNMEEMFDLLTFYNKKKVINKEVAIVSNAGGPLVSTVDLLSKKGIALNEFSRDLAKELEKALPPIVKIKNPLDIIGDADAERYANALRIIVADNSISNLLVLLTPQSSTQVKKTAEVIAELTDKFKDKNIFASFIGGESIEEAKKVFKKNKIICFEFPNKAVNILAKIIHYVGDKKNIHLYKMPPIKNVKPKNYQMDFLKAMKFIDKYGIKTVESQKIEKFENLAKLGYPIALKAVGKDFIHKTEKKAVFVNIKDKIEAKEKLDHLLKMTKKEGNYTVGQKMVKAGMEMIVGFKRDESFGPIIMVGMGGIYTEVFKDIQTEVEDITKERAEKMIKKLRIYPILKGVRGEAGYNIEALAETIVNIAKLARDNPNIHELDINPLFITSKEAIAADVRIIV